MGRPRGSRNKTGAEVKAQLLACYERLGGLKSFTEWAKTHSGEFYRMYAQLAPKEITGDFTFTDATDLTDEQLADIATGSSAGAVEQTDGTGEPGPVH